MGWNGDWPLIKNVSKTTAWAMLDQLWEAAAEKRLCLNDSIHWPPANTVWGGGTVTSLENVGSNLWKITDSNLAELPTDAVDNGKYWNGGTRPTTLCTSATYWESVSCNQGSDGGLPYLNGNYEIIIEDFSPGDWRDLKPWQVVRGTIVANTNRTLTANIRIDDHVTAGYLASASTLVGKRYYIIRQGKLWWADKDFDKGRYPDFPNDPAKWLGSAEGGKVYSSGKGYLVETTNKYPRDPYNQPVEYVSWAADRYKTREVLIQAGDLKRLTITSNDRQTLFFGGLDHIPTADEEAGTGDFHDQPPLTTAFTLGGNYSIVVAGGKGYPGRKGFAPFWWYGGAQDTLWTHDPSDAFIGRATAFAADEVHWSELGSLAGDCACGDDCSRVSHTDTLDNDLVSSRENFCEPAEMFYAPHLYKTPRGLQAYVEAIVGYFVQPDQDYGGSAAQPNAYSLAQCFYDCGINSGTTGISKECTTVVSGSSTITNCTYFFTVATAYRTIPICFDILKSNGTRATSSNAFVLPYPATGRIVTGSSSTSNSTDATAADLANGIGGSVVYSAGWLRNHPKEFTHLYPATGFVPEIEYPDDPLDGEPYPIYPPEVFDFCCDRDDPPPSVCCKSCFGVGGSAGVGGWIKRDPSSGFKTFDAYGYAINGGGDSFAAGDLVRYAGDNWQDPGTDQRREIDDDVLDLPFWDRFGEFTHPRGTKDALAISRKGYVTASSKGSITDDAKNWFANWYGGGVAKTHSGNAIAGSSTTLTISGDYADTAFPENCWIQAGRFVGFSAPFVGFILEVDKTTTVASVTTTTTFKMPITDVTALAPNVGNQPVIHFAAQDGFTVAANDQWRIREPGTNLSRFEGRRVRFTALDGTQKTIEIKHNDDKTLFFDPQSAAIEVGSTYEIIEYHPGGVWQFATTQPTDNREWQKIGDGKYWIQPLGTDARGEDFHKLQTENAPHKFTKFGKILKGDYISFDLLNQLYLMLNRLRWTITGVGWNSRKDPAVREVNDVAVDAAGINNIFPYGESDTDEWKNSLKEEIQRFMDGFATIFGPTGMTDFPENYNEVSGPPAAEWSYSISQANADTSPSFNAYPHRRYAYPIVTTPKLIPHTVELYALTSKVNSALSPELEAYNDGDYFNMGDPFIEDVYALFQTMSFAVGESTKIGDKVGQLETPPITEPKLPPRNLNWDYNNNANPPDIGEPYAALKYYNTFGYRGYKIDNTVGVAKWDGAGGLRYLP